MKIIMLDVIMKTQGIMDVTTISVNKILFSLKKSKAVSAQSVLKNAELTGSETIKEILLRSFRVSRV